MPPVLANPNMTRCFPCLVRNCIGCFENYRHTKCLTVGGFLHSVIVLYLYKITCTHTELLNNIDNTFVILCYCLTFQPFFKKNLIGEEDRHSMFLTLPIFRYCYDPMKNCLRKVFQCSKSQSTKYLYPNCAHIFLIHSAESPVRYFINILLFHVQKLFNWSSKYA